MRLPRVASGSLQQYLAPHGTSYTVQPCSHIKPCGIVWYEILRQTAIWTPLDIRHLAETAPNSTQGMSCCSFCNVHYVKMGFRARLHVWMRW